MLNYLTAHYTFVVLYIVIHPNYSISFNNCFYLLGKLGGQKWSHQLNLTGNLWKNINFITTD